MLWGTPPDSLSATASRFGVFAAEKFHLRAVGEKADPGIYEFQQDRRIEMAANTIQCVGEACYVKDMGVNHIEGSHGYIVR